MLQTTWPTSNNIKVPTYNTCQRRTALFEIEYNRKGRYIKKKMYI